MVADDQRAWHAGAGYWGTITDLNSVSIGIALDNDIGEAYTEPVIYYPTESTPNIVEAHLRADRNLKPEMAKALAELFRVAYSQFSNKQTDQNV